MSTQSNPRFLNWRDTTFLLVIAFLVDLFIVSIQPVPGYMDASYYYATGIQLAEGHGFNEPFLWNYLDNPESLPHPSHSYWYPLASIISAIGMVLAGRTDFLSARLGFIIIAPLFPLAIATLALRISKKRGIALVSGFLAIFCGYYLPFIVTTDNYAVYMLSGAIFFLLLERITLGKAFILGLLAGLLNLARADGLLWMPLTLLTVFLLFHQGTNQGSRKNRTRISLLATLISFGGYIAAMGLWLGRNLIVFGALTPPGSSFVLWMTGYNQIFSFTPEIYTFSSWLSIGWQEIIGARLNALWQNIGTAFMAQGLIFLSPLLLIGGWVHKRLPMVKFAFSGWVILLFAESFLFPFASVRGGFFHAGAVLQPAWYVLAPLGLDAVLNRIKTTRSTIQYKWVFQVLLIAITVAMSWMLVNIRVQDSGWNEGEYIYLQAEEMLVTHGISMDTIVMVVNPPAYNAMTGRQAVVLPDGDIQTLLSAAESFNVEYVILEKDRLSDQYMDLYLHPQNHPRFVDIGGFDDVRLFFIKPAE